jgi:hypothetical protein
VSKARAKGTRGENRFLPVLRDLFGEQVERAPLKGALDNGDYVGVPWLHECKSTAKPLFQAWARVARKKAGGPQWILIWKGDERTADGQPLVLMDLAKYVELVRGQCF